MPLERLLDAIEAHAGKLQCGIAFLGVTVEDEPLWSALRARRYPESVVDFFSGFILQIISLAGRIAV